MISGIEFTLFPQALFERIRQQKEEEERQSESVYHNQHRNVFSHFLTGYSRSWAFGFYFFFVSVYFLKVLVKVRLQVTDTPFNWTVTYTHESFQCNSNISLKSSNIHKSQNTAKDDNTANYILFLSFTERKTDKLAINTFLQHSANPPPCSFFYLHFWVGYYRLSGARSLQLMVPHYTMSSVDSHLSWVSLHALCFFERYIYWKCIHVLTG